MGKITFDNKISAVGSNPANWTPQMQVSASDINQIKTVINGNADQSNSYKSFVGRLNFSGTFGVTKVFSAIGDFTVTNPQNGLVRLTPVTAGSLVANKTLVFLGNGRRNYTVEVDYSFIPSFIDINAYNLQNTQTDSPALTMAIEIRVYD